MSLRKYATIAGILVLGVFCGIVSVWAYGIVAKRATTLVSGAVQVTAPGLPAAGVGGTGSGIPEELTIPAIGVNAQILPIGLAANGDLGAPANATTVVWYKNGTRPGDAGVAIIDGHLDTIHSPEAVFYDLNKLQPGDEIDVGGDDGKTVVFKVQSVKTYPYNTPTQDIFTAAPGEAGLDLITCAGDWVPSIKLYDQRLVVFAVRQ